MAELTVTDILGAIRDELGADYAQRVPEYTRDNLSIIGNAITSNKNIMNDFMECLINKVAITTVKSKLFKNPLAKLKSNIGRPMGNTIEELFVNPATDTGYQKDGSFLLKTSKPDGKACYYGMNRQAQYPTSIALDTLSLAFTSEMALMNLYNTCVVSLNSGDNMDEFSLMKGLLGRNIGDGHILRIESDIDKPKQLAKDISLMSSSFTFPSTLYNGYNLVNKDLITAGETKVKTFCPRENQVLITRNDIMNEINYEVLASLYHWEVAQIDAMTIEVDYFNGNTDSNFEPYAVLCDKEALQVIDKLLEMDSEYIKVNRYWNVWLNHWQWLFLSLFANCVVFGKTTGETGTTATTVSDLQAQQNTENNQ